MSAGMNFWKTTDFYCGILFLVDVSDIYFLFFWLGEGEGGVRGVGGGGGSIFIENPRRGGVLQEGEGPRGREGLCGGTSTISCFNAWPNWFPRNVVVPGEKPLITITSRNSKRN